VASVLTGMGKLRYASSLAVVTKLWLEHSRSYNDLTAGIEALQPIISLRRRRRERAEQVAREQQENGLPRLGAQLNYLFETVPKPDGAGLWTNEEAAAAMTESGVSISAAYLSQLRTGKRDNPSARHLSGIANLFGVPLQYFMDPDVADPINADLRLLAAMRNSDVRGIALRAHGLSPGSLGHLAGIIEQIRKLEQLPDEERDETPPDPDVP
jgi:transcriptional regulator with XRE-family HTH domain